MEALDQLAHELISRSPEDVTFQVSEPTEPSTLRLVAQQINRLSQDWQTGLQREDARTQLRSKELSHAYEALQSKNDEIQRDLEAARRVQLQLLPQAEELPQREEIEFAGFYQSKDKVGGDLYDFIRIGKNSWGFLVADVSGHGVPSALLTMFLKAAFRTRARWGVGSDQICREVNAVLNPVVNDLGLFVTAFFGIVDLETAMFRYTNCGHPPVYLHRENTDELLRLDENGMILGAFDEVELSQSSLGLEEGDLLLAFTDGVPESRNYRDEMYGDDRLRAALSQAFHSRRGQQPTPQFVLDTIRKDLTQFTLGAGADDDITLAAFRFLHKAPEKSLENADTDQAVDRTRRRKLLINQLRREAREASHGRQYPLAEVLLRSLTALEGSKLQDRLWLSLVLSRQDKTDEAQALARTLIDHLAPDSAHARLAHSILARSRKLSPNWGADAPKGF